MSPSRSGVALVLALVILAALLLLGLPFLFSQSSSVAGARSFSDQVATQEGQRSVERGGLGAGALAGRSGQLRAAGTQYASLVEDIEAALSAAGATTCTAAAIAGDRNRIRVILSDSATAAGVVVNDEAGRLDANALSAREWDALLTEVGITDWDDNEVVHSRCDPYYNWSSSTWVNVSPSYHQNNDTDSYGQLADALADARFNKGRFPSQRYTALEDLLLADPGHNREQPPTTSPYPGTDPTPPSPAVQHSFGFRRPLTRAELELLRPYLTFRSYGQGKHGAIEVGSAVSWTRPDPFAPARTATEAPRGRSVDLDVDLGDAMRDGEAPSAPIARHGTVGILRWKNHGQPMERRFRYWSTGGRSIGFDENDSTYPDTLNPSFTGFQFAIEAPSPINLNQASGVVRRVLEAAMGATLAAPATLPGAPLSTLGGWNLGWLDPVWSGAEFGQVGIRSVDVFGIESAATIADYPAIASQRPVGLTHRRRRVVAQCLPHDEPVVARWDSQAALIAQVRSRATTPMVTWPVAVPRLDSPTQRPSDLPTVSTGFSPAPLPGPACNARYNGGTTLHCRGATAGAVIPGLETLAESDITPEGIVLRGLSIDQNSSTAAAIITHVSPGDQTQMAGRSIGFWMKLPAGFSATSASILTLNRPDLARDADGAAGGDPALQNHFSLTYQTTPFPRLVLALANDAQPLLADIHGQNGRPKVAGDPYSGTLDPRASEVDATGKALAPKRPLNRVELHYTIAQPGFAPDRWYLVQVAIANERPGGQAIIVDGIVGREATTVDPLQVEVDKGVTGDHVHLPGCLVLNDPLVANDYFNWVPNGVTMPSGDYGAVANRSPADTINTLRLRPLGSNVLSLLGGSGFDAVLPARGMVQIGDEYLSYEGISGDGLTTVRRGQRQNTHLGASATMARWVTMPAHRAGDLVLPGGVRLVNPGGGNLLTGQASLVDDLGPGHQGAGDPSLVGLSIGLLSDKTQYGLAGHTTSGDEVRDLNNGPAAGTLYVDQPSLFPSAGYVLIRAGMWSPRLGAPGIVDYIPAAIPVAVYYEGVVGNQLQVPGGLAGRGFMPGKGETTIVLLNSIQATNAAQVMDNTNFAVSGAIQIEHPSDGRIEWCSYTQKLQNADGSRAFFVLHAPASINWNFPPAVTGWSARGIERTPFFGRSNPDRINAGATILPVQTMIGSGYMLATGDTVTLAADPANNGTRIQRVVRYRPCDQFGPGTDPTAYTLFADTHNHYFAFTRKVDGTFALGASELQVWPCWNGRDLSPYGNAFGGNVVSGKTGLMPRVFRDPGAGVPLVMGQTGTDLTIDSLAAAPQTGNTVDGGFAGRVTGINNSAVGTVWSLPSSTVAGLALNTDVPAVFASVAGGRACVLVGGEDMVVTSTGDLRGRSLFGSQATAMSVTPRHLDCYNASATTPAFAADWFEGPSVLQLPIGPIGELSWLDAKDPLDATGTTFLRGGEAVTAAGSVANLVRSPVLMLVSPDGQHRELVGTVQPTTFSAVGATTATAATGRFITAPWTRGLYQTQVDGGWNTPPAGALSGLNHLVVSWWLRHPPPIPLDDSLGGYLSSSEREALWNCRSFSWAGFALRRAGAVFDPTLFPSGLKPAEVAGTLTAGQQQIVVAALADGRNWAAVQGSAAAAFNHGQFGSGIETDGAELRLVWCSNQNALCNKLEEIAALANQVPKAGTVILRCLAPTRILAVEEAR